MSSTIVKRTLSKAELQDYDNNTFENDDDDDDKENKISNYWQQDFVRNKTCLLFICLFFYCFTIKIHVRD